MNDFLRNLASPGWWLGVVIVSFLINLAAAYAKPVIDLGLARISNRRRRKLERTKTESERQVGIIERTPNGVVLLTLEELKLVLGAILFMSFCILILVFLALPIPSLPALKPPIELLFLIPILLIAAILCMREASKKANLLRLLKGKHDHNEA